MFKNPIIKSDISRFFISVEGSAKREQMRGAGWEWGGGAVVVCDWLRRAERFP